MIDKFRVHLVSRGMSLRTIETYVCISVKFVRWLEAQGSSESPTVEHVVKFIGERRKSSSHRLILSVLISFFQWRGDHGFLVESMRGMRAKIPNKRLRRENTASRMVPDIVSRILMLGINAKTFFEIRDQCAFRVCMDLGVRATELCSLKVDDLDHKKLSETTREFVLRYLEVRKTYADETFPYLFVSGASGKQMTRQGFWKRFRLACEHAGGQCGDMHPRSIRYWKKNNAA